MTKPDEHKHCQEYLKQLSDYIDGELDPRLCAKIEEHLHGCTNCTVVVDTLKRTIELYQDEAIQEEIPQPVKQRLYSRLSLDEFLK
jgi:anti-sigma factor (TIGR02949 family)